MQRLHVILALAGTVALGMLHPAFAQTTPAPTGQSAAPPAGSSDARDAAKAQRKALRVAARSDCRAHGKQQSLTGPALKDYVKSCMAQQH